MLSIGIQLKARRSLPCAHFVAAAIVTTVALAHASPAAGAVPARPFGSHPAAYAAGSILPNHLSQATLDQAVRDFYDSWKAEYLSQDCGAGRYLVRAGIDSANLTVSEAHGYGMIIAALMAGHDPNAQTIFDGLYAFFKDHPTATHANLMSWYQNNSCNDAQGNDSAADGDLDIAFALLLADDQWGSAGAIDYASQALAVLADIKDGDLDATNRYVKLGDWVLSGDAKYYPSTRSSDFMMDHYRSFANASADPDWSALTDRSYAIISEIQTNYSATTGLLPDFVLNPLTTPTPANPGFLEGPTDGYYSYNAARDPWRIGSDFLVSGDPRAKAALDPLNAWIRAATGEQPSSIRAGYKLDGSPVSGSNYQSLAFIAPFGVGAMVDASNQSWLNDIWDLLVSTPLSAEGYFENTLKVLSMLVMSGNWWAPDAYICGDAVVDPGEQCDDGNSVDGDGCDSNCTTTGCGNAIVTAGEQCDDGNLQAGDCCDASCQFEIAGTGCDDGEYCTLTDTCDGTGSCQGLAQPSVSCIVPLAAGKSVLLLKDRASRDVLSWKWGRGPEVLLAAFGNPDVTDDYRLCIYEQTGPAASVFLDASAPSSPVKWSSLGTKGFKYKDADLIPDGLRLLKVKPGPAGKAKIKVKGKGANLAITKLGFDPSATITVQLHAGSGSCFGAAYSAPFSRNDSGQFKAGNTP